MAEDEFWGITPRMFKSLLDRFEAQEERDYFRSGVISSVIANVNRDPKVKPKPYKPADFMPVKKKKKKPMYTDHQLKAIERINTLLGIGAAHGHDR